MGVIVHILVYCMAVIAVSGNCHLPEGHIGPCHCGFTLGKGCFLKGPKAQYLGCQCHLTGNVHSGSTSCYGCLVQCRDPMLQTCANTGETKADCLQGVMNGIGNCNGYTNGSSNELETMVAVHTVSGAPQAKDTSEECNYDGCRGTGCSCGFTLNKGCFLSSPKPSFIACQCRLTGSIHNGGTRCDGRLVYCNNPMSTACAAQGDTKVDCLQGVKNGTGNCNGYIKGSSIELETMVAVHTVSGAPNAKDHSERCNYGLRTIGPCECGFTLDKGCFLSAPKPRFLACQCHLTGNVHNGSTSCYGCLVQCSTPMLQTCANIGDTKADCLQGVKNSIGNCNGYTKGSSNEDTTRFNGQGNLAGGSLGALNQASQIISGAFGGVGASGSSSSWSSSAAVSGSSSSWSSSAAVTKQGLCPPDRPSCPPTMGLAPPRRCSNDGGCADFGKCCYDTCLQYYNCKPPFVLWK